MTCIAPNCKNEIVRRSTGRPPIYCSKKCNRQAYEVRHPKDKIKRNKLWMEKHPDQVRVLRQKYYAAAKESGQRARWDKKYRLGHSKDPHFKLRKNLRERLRNALLGRARKGSAVGDLGCSIQELKIHLEKLFLSGMSWENYGEWHIDHIKPLSSYNLTVREQLLDACHYTNLQPLWATDNLRKSDKLTLEALWR